MRTLVEVTRGNMVESVHQGAIVVVNTQGNIVAQVGNPEYQTYMRSAAKPIQALPVIERGAAEYFQLSEAELAIISASHSGEQAHQQAVKGILQKIGLDVNDLLCGASKPFHKPTAKKLESEGKKPEAIHCPCSGKHAGMLALTIYEKEDKNTYYMVEHPTQQIMLQTIAEFCEVPREKIELGVDGCGVPVFGMSVKAMAQAYANFAKPVKFNNTRQEACQVLHKCFTREPHLIAGTGRFTTELLQQVAPKVIAKDGGEAVFCMGIPEKGWGIAIKIADGSARALNPIVMSTLDQLGLLSVEDKQALVKYCVPQVKNFRGEVIGKIKPVFTLEKF